jgi:hypothetical protein
MRSLQKRFLLACAFVLTLHSVTYNAFAQEREYSAAFERYKKGQLHFENENAFFPTFNYQLTTGLGYFAEPTKDTSIQKKLALYKKDPHGLMPIS